MTVFGADAHVALTPSDTSDACAFTDVSRGDAASLSTADLAALPAAARAELRAAQRAQLLAAIIACIEAQCAPGFVALRIGAARVVSSLSAPLDALVAALETARNHGMPTRESLYTRIHQAESLEAHGRFAEAAALYRGTLDEDMRYPELHLLRTPPLIWSYYGLALKRAGQYQQAGAAYDAGLRALERGCYVKPDTPLWRDSLRLGLLDLKVTLWGNFPEHMALRDAALHAMFPEQLKVLQSLGETSYKFDRMKNPNDPRYENVQLSGITTRRRWVMQAYDAPRSDPLHAGSCLHDIVELPPGPPPSRTPGDYITRPDVELARDVMRLRSKQEAAPLPKLPASQCASCGASGATKRCSACLGPAYCGPDCQKAHWKAHKAACKAARAGGSCNL